MCQAQKEERGWGRVGKLARGKRDAMQAIMDLIFLLSI